MMMVAASSTALSPEDAERFRSFERQRHDNLATTYHDFFTPITALAIKPLLDAVRLQTGIDLLDVATGPGSLAAEASGLGARTVGVDLSPGMIELAAKSYPGIDFRLADVEHLPFADRSFDAVVCNFALGHFPYPEASVAECVRTLRQGGRIALSWWDDPSKQRIQGLFREAITEIGVAPPPDVPKGYSIFRFADTNEFRRLLEGVGLTDVMVQEHKTTYLIRRRYVVARRLGQFCCDCVGHRSPGQGDTGSNPWSVKAKSCRLQNSGRTEATRRLQDRFGSKSELEAP
jgi:SAM-dependent methyltransferase